jgi:hypothetical protein
MCTGNDEEVKKTVKDGSMQAYRNSSQDMIGA